VQPVGGPVEAGEVAGLRQQALLPHKHRRHACLVGCEPVCQVYVATDFLQSANQGGKQHDGGRKADRQVGTLC
jgi:hypothetical protein